jgi:hypothetical protein
METRTNRHAAILTLCFLVSVFLDATYPQKWAYAEQPKDPPRAPDANAPAQSAPMPGTVGRYAERDALVFRGNRNYTDEQIRIALFGDIDVIAAIFPESSFSAYLETLRKKTVAGYRDHGFYDPGVQVSFDGQRRKVIIDINEGTRYRKGPIVITGVSDTLKQDISKRLKTLEGQAAQAAGGSRQNTTELMVSNSGTPVYPLIRDEGGWACFNESLVEHSRQYVGKLMNRLGYYNARFDLKVVPIASSHTAELQLTFSSEGVRPRIGTIDISGNSINKSEDVAIYLGIEKGSPINDTLVRDIELKLRQSGRFRSHKTAAVVEEGAPENSTVRIVLEETPSLPPLGTGLSEKAELLRKIGLYLSDSTNRVEDLHLTLKAPIKYLPFTMEGVVSPQKGMLLTESSDGQIANALTIDRERIRFVSPLLGQYVSSPTPIARISVIWAAIPDNERKNEWLMTFAMGFTTDDLGGRTGELTYDIQMDLSPAFWVSQAGKEETVVTDLDKDTVLIKFRGKTEIKADRATGKVREFSVGEGFELSIRFKEGVFDEQLRKIQAQADAASLKAVEAKGIGQTLLSSGLSLYLTHAPDCPLTLEQKRSAVKALNRMFARAATDCSPSQLQARTGEDFSLASYEAMDSTANMMRLVMGMVFSLCHENLTQDDWLYNLAHVGALMVSGRAQSTGVERELNMLYSSDKIGPVSYSLMASTFKALGSPAYRPFAERARQSLSADDFRKDWMPLAAGDSRFATYLQCSLDNLRSVDTNDVRAVALVFPPKLGPLLETIDQRLKESSRAPLPQTLDPLLSQAWESSLRQMVLDNLEQGKPDRNARLISAARTGTASAVQTALAEGCDINARTSDTGATVLMVALENGRGEVARLLVDKGADVNAARKSDGITALWIASCKGDVEVVRLLLEKGADVNDLTNNGGTALITAAENGRTEVVRLLIVRGAEVNAKATFGGVEYTALKMARENRHAEVIGLLEKAGAKE